VAAAAAAAVVVVVVVRGGKLTFGARTSVWGSTRVLGVSPKGSVGAACVCLCLVCLKIGREKRSTAILVATHTHRQTHRQKSWAIGNAPPLCTRICPYPFFEVTPPGAAPGPPVKTGARVRRFWGCNQIIKADRLFS